MARRFVTDAELGLDPTLLGNPLASPRRRLAAIFVDWLLLAIPSLVVALAMSLFFLWHSEPRAMHALIELLGGQVEDPAREHELYRQLAPLMVEKEMPGVPTRMIQAVEDGDLDTAAHIFAEYDLMIALKIGGGDEEVQPGHIRVEMDRFVPSVVRAASSYGVGAIYFSLFLAWAGGATPGKHLLRIRVVRLDGRELSLLAAFERFLGYWQIPASLGFSILDLWRDPNRRLPHDRLVHTVVIWAPRTARRPLWRRCWQALAHVSSSIVRRLTSPQ